MRGARGTSSRRGDGLLLLGAGLVAISGGIHVRLHREQYREIHLDRIVGIDFAGSIVLAVAAAIVISTLLVISVVFGIGRGPAALAGVAYAAGAVVAYVLARTVGLLGFEENRWVPEAVVAKPLELAAIVVLALALVLGRRARTTTAR